MKVKNDSTSQKIKQFTANQAEYLKNTNKIIPGRKFLAFIKKLVYVLVLSLSFRIHTLQNKFEFYKNL